MNNNPVFSAAVHPDEEKCILLLEESVKVYYLACRRTVYVPDPVTGSSNHFVSVIDQAIDCILARIGNRSRNFSQENEG